LLKISLEIKDEQSDISINKFLFKKKFLAFVALSVLVVIFGATDASAFSWTVIFKEIFGISSGDTIESSETISEVPQKPFPFLSATPPANPKNTDVEIIDDIALASAIGPMGNVVEAAESSISYKISTYTVREGDSLSLIAHSFGVSINTLTWANDIPPGGVIKPGQVLVILPVSGVRHVVKKGDTISTIAKKYSGDPDDIINFNDISSGDSLTIGSVIVIPDGEVVTPLYTSPSFVRGGGPEIVGYYLRPVYGGSKTQGLHGYNGVDIAKPYGSIVRASASGTVIVGRASGWNGGYGKYVVISHPNGTQTLYAHLNGLATTIGSQVSRGQTIGYVGSTGKSTGSHLHFEVRGAKNPF
jgi:LysM repeat protein